MSQMPNQSSQETYQSTTPDNLITMPTQQVSNQVQYQGNLAMQPQTVQYQQPAQVVQFPQQIQAPSQAPLPQQVSSPTPSQEKGNPWETAFNKVVSLLSSPPLFPQQAAQQSQPAQYNPNNPYSAAAFRQAHQSPQTLPSEQTNPAQYGNNYSQMSSPQYQNVPGRSEAVQSWGYPSEATAELRRSDASFASTEELIQAMGPRAAEMLNESHCKLEDMYQQQAQQLAELNQFALTSVDTMAQLYPHIQRYQAMENMVTDPDRLAAYTVDFFNHVHPLPPRENAVRPLVRPDFPSSPSGNGGNGEMQLRDVRPEQRWMVADQMERQGLMRGKQILVGGY
jgi:hypothetical protein